jgi:hypothetical protein
MSKIYKTNWEKKETQILKVRNDIETVLLITWKIIHQKLDNLDETSS